MTWRSLQSKARNYKSLPKYTCDVNDSFWTDQSIRNRGITAFSIRRQYTILAQFNAAGVNFVGKFTVLVEIISSSYSYAISPSQPGATSTITTMITSRRAWLSRDSNLLSYNQGFSSTHEITSLKLWITLTRLMSSSISLCSWCPSGPSR